MEVCYDKKGNLKMCTVVLDEPKHNIRYFVIIQKKYIYMHLSHKTNKKKLCTFSN